MSKLNAKLVGATLLLCTLTATAETDTVESKTVETQSVPVMTFSTLKGLNNLNRNMKAERMFPRNNLFDRNRANELETLAYPRFRGIDMSDEPLLGSAKQIKAKRSQSKPQSQTRVKDDALSSDE